MSTLKVATTEQFVAINDAAVAEGYNRSLTEEFMASLDPEGVHVCSFWMLHEHKAGQPCEPHMRTMWFAKLAGSVHPVQVQQDVRMDLWEGLEDYVIPGDAA